MGTLTNFLCCSGACTGKIQTLSGRLALIMPFDFTSHNFSISLLSEVHGFSPP